MGKLSERTTSAFDGMKAGLRKPTTGAAIVGGAIVGSATLFGLLETVVGVAAGYGVYRALKNRHHGEGNQGGSEPER
jgi:hypothetical protein